ncbi:AAA family ATPase [Ferrimonas aestuarii]|uniref:Toprim domain-containing protein n=1 Tax=Ferrimonas aestuarii TaxID=2569539 RepID=A0A4U1BRV7_9GAMM|nr:AAA family ATPase [Ferrimonas aestuarii]TKB58363.1 hypothetical protein FCL42_01030 [Ferrimonas aestuarii]
MTGHQYLQNKGLGEMQWPTISQEYSIGGCHFEQGDLIVVLTHSETGKPITAQLINKAGDKRFLPKLPTKGGVLWLGKSTTESPQQVLVCEGLATGLSLYNQHKKPVIVAFSVHNLGAATKAAKACFPDAKLIIGADNDGAKQSNIGVEVAKTVAADLGAWVAVPPEHGDWNDYYVKHGVEKMTESFVGAMHQPPALPKHNLDSVLPKVGSKPFPFTFGSQGYDVVSPYLIKNLLPANSMGVVYGPSGHFKSFLVLSMACALASGTSFDGRQVNQSSVLYVAGEGGTGVPRRIKGWEVVHNQGQPVQNLAVISQPIYLADAAQLQALIDTIAEIPFSKPLGLIIIDTLARCFAGADENKASDMNLFIAKLDELRRRTGATVLVVHHSGKDADKGARGSSALRAAADFEYSVKRLEEDDLAAELNCTKMKDDSDSANNAYQLKVKQLFRDSDGDPVTTLVCQLESFEPAPVLKESKLGKNSVLLWQAVRSRYEKQESTCRAVLRDDMKKMGLNTSNFGRWANELVEKKIIKIEDDNFIPI